MREKLAIIVLSILLMVGVYILGVSRGEISAQIKYEEQIKEYQASLDRQTKILNNNLDVSGKDLTQEINKLLSDTQQIRVMLKNQPQPLVFVQNGECVISTTTSDARRKIIERVNK